MARGLAGLGGCEHVEALFRRGTSFPGIVSLSLSRLNLELGLSHQGLVPVSGGFLVETDFMPMMSVFQLQQPFELGAEGIHGIVLAGSLGQCVIDFGPSGNCLTRHFQRVLLDGLLPGLSVNQGVLMVEELTPDDLNLVR